MLFGNVLGVDNPALVSLAILAVLSLIALGAIARPLIFASLQSELAEAKGVPLRFVSTAFLMIVAVAVSNARRLSAFSWFSR